MRATGLLILVAATVGAVAAVRLVVQGDEQAAAAGPASGALFPDLLDKAGDITEVSIESHDEAVTLKLQDGAWVLLERGGFPATFETIQAAVVGLGRLTIVEPKSAKAANHKRLGVEAPDAEGSESKRVEVRGAGGEEICSLIVGSPSYQGGTQRVYVRRSAEDQVYLCEGRLELNPSPTSWIERDLIRLDRSRVAEVEVQHADGESVLVGRTEESAGTYELQNLPEGRALKSPAVANGVGTALSFLSLEDVRPVDGVDFEAEPLAKTSYRCEDGLVILAETARFEEKTWIRLSASYEEAVGPVAMVVEEDPGESEADDAESAAETVAALDEPPANAVDPEAIRREVEELNGRLNGWAYVIPQYKVDVIARRMADLLAPLESAQEGEPAVGAQGDELPFSMEELMQSGAFGDGE